METWAAVIELLAYFWSLTLSKYLRIAVTKELYNTVREILSQNRENQRVPYEITYYKLLIILK